METKSIYELQLHEGTWLSFGIFVMRVEGGWIYDCWDSQSDSFKSGTFVPFSNEFQEVKTELESWMR